MVMSSRSSPDNDEKPAQLPLKPTMLPSDVVAENVPVSPDHAVTKQRGVKLAVSEGVPV
jgi:hypothetical protein